jgi:hypothetical protein
MRRSANSAAAGNDAYVVHRYSFCPDSAEAIPQIVIFRGGNVVPSAGAEVKIGSHAKIRAMHVRMGTVRLDVIRATETRFGEWAVFAKTVDFDGARDSFDAAICQIELIAEPS